MKLKAKIFKLAITFVLFLFLFPGPVYAYLDPGGVSSLLQIILAGLVGAFFAFKNFIFKIKTFRQKVLGYKSLGHTPHRPAFCICNQLSFCFGWHHL